MLLESEEDVFVEESSTITTSSDIDIAASAVLDDLLPPHPHQLHQNAYDAFQKWTKSIKALDENAFAEETIIVPILGKYVVNKKTIHIVE